MKRKYMRILALVMAVAIFSTLIVATPAFAATSQDVTVTATPSYIAISNAGGNWTLNGITGDSTIDVNTTYYANPLGDTTAPSATVVDGECKWTLTDTSSVRIDLKVTMTDFTGGSANMTNSNAGTNGATTYGAYSWYSGQTYSSKVIIKTSGSSILYTSASAGSADIKWGAEVKSQTDAWAGSSPSTATMTITATKM